MNILDKIVAHKKVEVDERKKLFSIDLFQNSELYNRNTISLKNSFENNVGNGIIAEFKRKSPSKGWFLQNAKVEQIVQPYQQFGASAVSILTDEHFFGGTLEDLKSARSFANIPLLRKDFMIDTFQIHEAKAFGADLILLIAAILSPDEVKEFAAEARSIGLEVLLEIHSESELAHISDEVDFVGVNNRDLKTFTVDINESIKLSKQIPEKFIKISESGIDKIETIQKLKGEGFKGFLLGEKFMKESDPGIAFKNFVADLNN